jgi:signal transduction histidine kinase
MPVDIELDSFPGALAQVLTNLLTNAGVHAFGEDYPADLERRVDISAAVEAGDWVTLKITDNSRGIAEHVIPHIFEPFFTTKRGAGGTGLGMHIVYNLVTQRLGGQITVTSVAGLENDGHGTTFVVKVPRTAPPPAKT